MDPRDTPKTSRKAGGQLSQPSSDIRQALSDSLELMQARRRFEGPMSASQLSSSERLYEQLAARCDAINSRPTPPVRLLHHFACTGGTLISKFLAASPNVRLLSEVDPLSPIAKHQFSPLDLAAHFQQSSATMRDAEKMDIFLSTLEAIYRQVILRGETLVLRDHPHSHFCTGARIANRPTLSEIIAPRFPIVSVVTVRHPLDSFLSVLANRFTHFSPLTLEEYCTRYRAFLAAYAAAPIVKYEDLLEDPEHYTPVLCRELEIPYEPEAWNWIGGVTLTGDSGRSGDIARPRPRRDIPENVVEMRKNSASYEALCEQLNYAP